METDPGRSNDEDAPAEKLEPDADDLALAVALEEDNAEVEIALPRPWMPDFLASYARNGNVSQACRETRISDESVRLWRKNDEGFARAFARARRESNELLEQQARVWATVGVETTTIREKVIDGKTVERTTIVGRDRSPALLGTLLRATNPEKYEPKVRVTGADGAGPVKHEHEVTLVSELAAEARADLERIRLAELERAEPDAA